MDTRSCFIGFWPPKTLWLSFVPELTNAEAPITEASFNMLLTQILLAGTLAARPTASTLPNGTLYASTDTGEIYQVQSAAWVTWFPAAPGTGTVTNVATGTGLTGGPITSTGTIDLEDTAVSPDTYGDATHVAQITIDQQGRITAATDIEISGGGGGGGALTLLEHITLTANATSATFSGLDGNADGLYKLIAKIKSNTANTCLFELRPNAESSNMFGTHGYFYGNTVGSTQTNSLVIGFTNGNAQACGIEATIEARKNANSVAQVLTMHGTYSNPRFGSNAFSGTFAGGWNDTSANITSLQIYSPESNGIADGSEFWLYKYGQ